MAKPLLAESPPAYVFISDAGICFVVVPSIIIIASESAIVIDDVDLAEPSSKFNSAAVESTAASLVKSACTNPDTPSSKFNSSGVDVICVVLAAANTGNVPD